MGQPFDLNPVAPLLGSVVEWFIETSRTSMLTFQIRPLRELSWEHLVAAPLLLDLLWPSFILTGWEQKRIEPGNTAFTPLDSFPILFRTV